MSNRVRRILLIVFAVIFVVSAVMLAKIFLDYKKDSDYYASLEEEYQKETVPEKKEPVIENGQYPDHEKADEDMDVLHTKFSYILVPSYNMDMVELQKMNPDIVGWITMKDTEINYPLLLGADNDAYIRTGPDGQPHNAGSIFLDYRCRGDFSTQNTVIYGHNQKNHKMFHDLYKFLDADFALAHPYFTIRYADGTEAQYEIFCSTQISAYAYPYNREYEDPLMFQAHIDQLKRDSKVDYGVEVTSNDHIVTLSTCTNIEDDDRIIVVARRLQ